MPIFGQPQGGLIANPLDFLTGGQQPQIDTMALIEEARRKKEEEEAERKRKEQEFLASLMQIQQAPKPVEVDEPTIMKQIMDQRFTPERQARLQQMRQDTPDVIQQRLADQYFGAPKSKLGKIGTAALKIATGALGAPTPDFRKLAMEQWIAQNKIANEEETSEARLAGEQFKGAVQQQRTAQMAQTAQERNKTMVGMKLIDAKIKEAQLEQQKLMDGYKAAGMDADTALKRAKLETEQRLQQTLGAAFPLLGVKDAAQAAALAKQMAANPNLTAAQRAEIEAYGGNLLKFTEGLEQSKNYRPGTPDRTVMMSTPTIRADSTGTPVEIVQQKPRFIPGKPQQGMPNAASQAYLQGATPSLVPQLPQQQEQPQGQAITPNLQPSSDTAPTRRLPLGAEFKSANRQLLQNPPPKEVAAEDRAAMNQVSQSASNNSFIRDAFLSGELDQVSSKWRGVLSASGLDKPVSTYYKLNDKTRPIETALQRLTTEETAAYLKKISGAQVSHQEYDRIKGMFPQAGNLAEQNLQLAYWNTVVPGVLLQLEQAGIMTGENAQKISDSLVEVAKRYSSQYMDVLRDIKAKGNSKEARGKYNLGAFTDMESVAMETLRKAFPESVGGTLEVPHSDRRFGVGVSRIPITSPSVRVQEMNSDRKGVTPANPGQSSKRKRLKMVNGELVEVKD